MKRKMWMLYVLSVSVSFYLAACYSYDSGEGYLRDIDPDWAKLSGRINQPKCIDIPYNLTLCRNIGYTRMRLPNLLDHDTINEVIQQSKSWLSLLGVYCHPDTKLFLCSLFSPVCLDRAIKPCRSLCESVKAGCEQTMLFYGYNWPEMVRCDKFPSDSELCIQPLHNITNFQNICSACRQAETFEALIDNYCRAGYVIKGKIVSVKNQGSNKVLYLMKKKKVIKKDVLTKKDRKTLNPFIQGGVHCECDRINITAGENYIIMGNKTADGGFTVTYLSRWSRKKSFRKAHRKMRKGINCSGSILDLNEADNQNKNKVSKNNKKGDNKVGKGGKGGKKGGKKKGKGKRKKGKKKDKKKGKNKKGKKKNRKGKKNKKRKNRRKGKKDKKDRKKDRKKKPDVLPNTNSSILAFPGNGAGKMENTAGKTTTASKKP